MSDRMLKKAYELAGKLKALAPWEYMDEAEVFGVEAPGSGKKYFISITGSGGMHFSMIAYEGARGLMHFWDTRQQETGLREDEILLVANLMVSFVDRDMIQAEVRRKIRALGLSFRGQNAWPDLRHTEPGFLPLLPEGKPLDDLVVVLEQTLDVCQRIKSHPELIYQAEDDQDKYLMRRLLPGKHGAGIWKDDSWMLELPRVSYEMKYISEERKRVSELPSTREVIQADITTLAQVVSGQGKKPSYVFLFLMVNKKTGMVVGFESLMASQGLDAMYARFPDLLIKNLLKLRWRPGSIEIRLTVLYDMASKVLGSTGMQITRNPSLEAVDVALEMLKGVKPRTYRP